ncbi:entericidin A/B family lipoprotein [Allofranklinella schreckenbergeri]|uniref:Entericidin A/B family lipoprotein n=1 Tax=Allofranklinella schreckenbergeri TaxID=1076744 RepID=A0A3M6R9J7_9BURK|nr:entericidin A/B family lipoprotein [Allofranklinella schreckenbergeri]MDO4705683.1 entericidin A/B family lipoprotein [Comamonadaceae bacterium]RMX11519.1 entericidin A/B family lipoprotein [Allofranklinella schreckenbergeri]
MMKTIASALFASLLALAVTGCNTVQGVGQDVQKGGAAIERAAEKAK